MDSDMKQSSETPSNIPTSKSNQQITQPSEETRKALKQPTFNVWGMERKQMLCLLEQMFYELDLVTEFKMEPETVRCFLTSVQKHYQENPFHNFYHGFSVTQMMYCVISQCQLQEHLSHIDILTLMVAALCHDLDHPGLSNSYQVNAQTDLARQYHNKSPLENHHWAVAWRILSQKQSNLLLGADPKQVPHIQQEIMELILATDMAHHGEILQTLQNIENFNFSNREHVTALKKGLIKICDISNEARPAEQAEIWADALMEEYFLQSDREKDEGLPVTPYMDRDKVKKADAQSSFISFLLIPLCEALCKHFPLLNNLLLQPLRAARLRYQQQMDNGMLERQDM
ncbi:phosphodiesterase 9A S homeolog [Xenopus laevis]|nr:phosphodiesterase 9A S homeolog [Xenopus laevis]AAH99362.1 MGC116558 protein [Xenopus laevis]